MLLSLPGEIRNHIYSYLFDEDFLQLDYKLKKRVEIENARPTKLRFDLQLMLTCRMIEKEVERFIFGNCTFSFHSDQALRKFVNMVPDENVARIQKLNLIIVVPNRSDVSNRSEVSKWLNLVKEVVEKSFHGLRHVRIAMTHTQSGTRISGETTVVRVRSDILEKLEAMANSLPGR